MKSLNKLFDICTGCSACAIECPTGAITMCPDKEGFQVPIVEGTRCIHCGKCIKICPVKKDGNYKEKGIGVFYVAKHRSSEVLMHSTSGGAFTAFSDVILAKKGVVYGAVFDDSLRVFHARAEDPQTRDTMCVSKYVQSNIEKTYEQIRADLKSGRQVLFTGTPCQTAGIRAIFGRPENLILCDVICHGVPSPLLWRSYLETLSQEQGKNVHSVIFRTKANGWHRGQYQIYYYVLGDVERKEDTRFFELYLRGRYILRSSCYNCPFADVNRASDITIADYWGIEKYSKKWYDQKGVSLVITNTKHGEELIKESEPFLYYERRSPSEELEEQGRLSIPVSRPANRAIFWDEFFKNGFSEAARITINAMKINL